MSETRFRLLEEFWLSQRPGRPHYYITWFDGHSGQTRRKTTSTGDLEEAERRLAEHFPLCKRLDRERPIDVPLMTILGRYTKLGLGCDLQANRKVRRTHRRLAIRHTPGAVCTGWMSVRLLRRARRLDHMRIAIDAEMFVGQELDQLMRYGAVVLHDVPAEKFNIDHLVIVRSGVFAVETKGRAKPIRGQGTKNASVVFDGSALHFPSWLEVKPIAQATRQANGRRNG